jgi:hypothetical protein
LFLRRARDAYVREETRHCIVDVAYIYGCKSTQTVHGIVVSVLQNEDIKDICLALPALPCLALPCIVMTATKPW